MSSRQQVLTGSLAAASLCLMSSAVLADVTLDIYNGEGSNIFNYVGQQILENPHDVMGGEGWFWKQPEDLDGNSMTGTLAWNEATLSWIDSGAPTGIDLGYALWWDQDPFVVLSVAFSNTTGIDQEFMFSATNGITGIQNTTMGGAVSGSATDANASGGPAVGPVSGPLYRALVDGVGVQDMYPAGSSWSYPTAGGSLVIPTMTFGQPGVTQPGPNALSTIGIEAKSFLGAGDLLTLNASFIILGDPIPAPGALALLGLAGIAYRRRRRS